jgi:hypothetical protein
MAMPLRPMFHHPIVNCILIDLSCNPKNPIGANLGAMKILCDLQNHKIYLTHL